MTLPRLLPLFLAVAVAGPAHAALMEIAPAAFAPNTATITFGDATDDGTLNPSYVVAPGLTVSFGSYFVGEQLTSGPNDGGLYYLTGRTPSGPLALASDPNADVVITTDASTGSDTNERLAGEAPGTFLGPVAVRFSTPVLQVAVTAGVFSEAGDLSIQAFTAGGTSLGVVSNAGAGSQRFYLADSNGAAIAGLSFFIPDQSLNGFSIDDVTLAVASVPTPVPEPGTFALLAAVLLLGAGTKGRDGARRR